MPRPATLTDPIRITVSLDAKTVKLLDEINPRSRSDAIRKLAERVAPYHPHFPPTSPLVGELQY